MTDPKDYILERLARLSKTDGKSLSESELPEHITRTVLSKKFRKYSVDDALHEHLAGAIQLNLARQEPMKFVMPFGGYKLWRLEEAPEVDWAELFSMMFYAAWLRPIAEQYEPGVWFDFSSDDVVIERLNNIPKEDTARYQESFEDAIAFLAPYLPKNMRFTFTPVGSRYTPEEFDTELDALMAAYLKENGGALPNVSESEAAMIDLNVRLNPGQDADPEWRAKNKLLHDAYLGMSKRRPYYKTDDKILVFTKFLPRGVAVGTTKTSIAKFWAGAGALTPRADSYIETVLSPEQIAGRAYDWSPIAIEGLKAPNFSRIRIGKSL